MEKAHDITNHRDREVGDITQFSQSLTKQADSKDADINHIIARYEKTGLLPVRQGQPQYGDFTHVTSYAEAMEQLSEAHTAFDALPAKIRARFGNDPGQFVAFADNPANLEALVQMGLVAREDVPLPPPVTPAGATDKPV